jgi:hypothetical protein
MVNNRRKDQLGEVEILKRRLNLILTSLAALFLFGAVEGLALLKAARYWEEAYWIAGECAFLLICFFIAGVVHVRRVKNQILPTNSPTESFKEFKTTEGNQ